LHRVSEWTTLTSNLGGEKNCWRKTQRKRNSSLGKSNTGSTNESGLTTLPGGYRNNHGAFANKSFFGFYRREIYLTLRHTERRVS